MLVCPVFPRPCLILDQHKSQKQQHSKQNKNILPQIVSLESRQSITGGRGGGGWCHKIDLVGLKWSSSEIASGV